MTDLKLITPSRNHPIVEHILWLEKLRHKKDVYSEIPPVIFYQIKDIFHFLESIGSARIEGNNTTISEAIEQRLMNVDEDHVRDNDEKYKEIRNIEKAITYIEENIQPNSPITDDFIREIQYIVTEGLDREGDREGGNWRTNEVRITWASFKPPLAPDVPFLMAELVAFINDTYDTKDQLLMTTIVHHRFTQIHPFNNGNWRTVRLLTYAMLLKLGILNQRQFLNPTAVFCINRDSYYFYLGRADTATDEGILEWADYVLWWLLNEIEKVDKLLDKKYLVANILVPALNDAKEREYVTELEYKILQRAIQHPSMFIEAKDVKDLFEGKIPQEVSRQLRKLKDKRLLRSLPNHKNKYVIWFTSSNLFRSSMRALKAAGFDAIIDSSID